MTLDSTALIDRLSAQLGPRGLTRDADLVTPWLTDWRRTTQGATPAMLSPASVEEVQLIVREARAAGATLTLQGGNSGMCAGATPGADGTSLLLSLRRLNRIRSLDADARMVVAEAGVVLATLQDAAVAAGCRFGLTLGGRGAATVGGLVSTNAGGTQVLRHGTMRGLTLGLEVVLADGTLLDALAPLAKDNRGPDPKQLFIGGEGAFGIVTAATLKLARAVAGRAVGWLHVDSPATALTLLRMLEDRLGNAIEGFEIVPDDALTHVLHYLPDARRPLASASPWHVLVEVVGVDDADGAAAALTDALAAASDRGLISDAMIAANEAQADALWALRDSIAPAERASGPALQHDVSVPVSAMPGFIATIASALPAQFSGARALSFGHLGDGNIHCHILPPLGADGAAWVGAHGTAVSDAVYAVAIALGGSISAEHGIGRSKRALLARVGDPARLAILRSLKAAMDPAGTLNPGVLIP